MLVVCSLDLYVVWLLCKYVAERKKWHISFDICMNKKVMLY